MSWKIHHRMPTINVKEYKTHQFFSIRIDSKIIKKDQQLFENLQQGAKIKSVQLLCGSEESSVKIKQNLAFKLLRPFSASQPYIAQKTPWTNLSGISIVVNYEHPDIPHELKQSIEKKLDLFRGGMQFSYSYNKTQLKFSALDHRIIATALAALNEIDRFSNAMIEALSQWIFVHNPDMQYEFAYHLQSINELADTIDNKSQRLHG